MAAWRLTVEEVSLLLSLLGQPGMGRDLLVAQLGPGMTADDARSRLLAGGHSLIAEGHAAVTADGRILLSRDLADIGKVLIDAPWSLRFTRSYQNAEFLLTYHFAGGQIYQHELEQGVVHCIETVEPGRIADEAMRFYELGQAETAFAAARLPGPLFNELMQKSDAAEIAAALRATGVSDDFAAALAQDLARAEYRGSMLIVHYRDDRSPVSDAGYLVLRSKSRSWLVDLTEAAATDTVTVEPGSENTLRAAVAKLTGTILSAPAAQAAAL